MLKLYFGLFISLYALADTPVVKNYYSFKTPACLEKESLISSIQAYELKNLSCSSSNCNFGKLREEYNNIQAELILYHGLIKLKLDRDKAINEILDTKTNLDETLNGLLSYNFSQNSLSLAKDFSAQNSDLKKELLKDFQDNNKILNPSNVSKTLARFCSAQKENKESFCSSISDLKITFDEVAGWATGFLQHYMIATNGDEGKEKEVNQKIQTFLEDQKIEGVVDVSPEIKRLVDLRERLGKCKTPEEKDKIDAEINEVKEALATSGKDLEGKSTGSVLGYIQRYKNSAIDQYKSGLIEVDLIQKENFSCVAAFCGEGSESNQNLNKYFEREYRQKVITPMNIYTAQNDIFSMYNDGETPNLETPNTKTLSSYSIETQLNQKNNLTKNIFIHSQDQSCRELEVGKTKNYISYRNKILSCLDTIDSSHLTHTLEDAYSRLDNVKKKMAKIYEMDEFKKLEKTKELIYQDWSKDCQDDKNGLISQKEINYNGTCYGMTNSTTASFLSSNLKVIAVIEYDHLANQSICEDPSAKVVSAIEGLKKFCDSKTGIASYHSSSTQHTEEDQSQINSQNQFSTNSTNVIKPDENNVTNNNGEQSQENSTNGNQLIDENTNVSQNSTTNTSGENKKKLPSDVVKNQKQKQKQKQSSEQSSSGDNMLAGFSSALQYAKVGLMSYQQQKMVNNSYIGSAYQSAYANYMQQKNTLSVQPLGYGWSSPGYYSGYPVGGLNSSSNNMNYNNFSMYYPTTNVQNLDPIIQSQFGVFGSTP